jgi:4-hydroxy-tetrahydrodipicolinate synthase
VLRLRALLGSEFRLLSGDDVTAPHYLALGGDGCISVTSNVAPRLCRTMYSAFRQGQIAKAQELAAALARLTAALFRESNPAPVKYALSTMALMSPRVRLPLVEVRNETKVAIDNALAHLAADLPGGLVGASPQQTGEATAYECQRRRKPELVVSL